MLSLRSIQSDMPDTSPRGDAEEAVSSGEPFELEMSTSGWTEYRELFWIKSRVVTVPPPSIEFTTTCILKYVTLFGNRVFN